MRKGGCQLKEIKSSAAVPDQLIRGRNQDFSLTGWVKVKGPEKPKDEGSRIVSVNFKRRIVRFVICFVHNVFTFTSLGISSLKFLLYLTSCCSDLPILRGQS